MKNTSQITRNVRIPIPIKKSSRKRYEKHLKKKKDRKDCVEKLKKKHEKKQKEKDLKK